MARSISLDDAVAARYAAINRRRDLCGLLVSLNGCNAKISGAYNQTATVWMIDQPQISIEFSWEVVERIVFGDGRFNA